MKVFAPAKVNFGLSVLGRRADGYHELHSLMVPLAVGDTLTVEGDAHLSLVVRGAQLPTGEGNLVYRAARAYLDAAGAWEGARIVLHKELPLASGLGGGSSDAAATLLALARLYPAAVDLPGLALRLGADVPFFLLGGAAVARGVGERLARQALPRTELVLVNPGVEVSARDAYGWLGEHGGFGGELDVPGVREALARGEAPPYFNSLQPPVVARHPEIRAALEVIRKAGLHAALMSGSGSTCFGLASSALAAEQAARVIRQQHPHWWVRATHTLGDGPRRLGDTAQRGG